MTTETAGQLRHRIEIQQAVETREASGEITQSWSTFWRCNASVEAISGTEQWRASQANPLLTSMVRMRWKRGVIPKMRVRFDDKAELRTRYLGIESVVNPNGKREWLHLMCEENANG